MSKTSGGGASGAQGRNNNVGSTGSTGSKSAKKSDAGSAKKASTSGATPKAKQAASKQNPNLSIESNNNLADARKILKDKKRDGAVELLEHLDNKARKDKKFAEELNYLTKSKKAPGTNELGVSMESVFAFSGFSSNTKQSSHKRDMSKYDLEDALFRGGRNIGEFD